jgi:glycosyltransferase involved in cell wall biosynthesis
MPARFSLVFGHARRPAARQKRDVLGAAGHDEVMERAPLEAVFYTRYAANGGSSRTRAFEYVEPLRAHGVNARVVSRVDECGVPDPAALDEVCDRAASGAVVVVQKPNLTFAQLDELLDASDGRLVVDFDDAIWMGYRPGDPADGLPSLQATLSHARLVTTGSEYLARWARTVTESEVHVLPPSLDLRRYQRVREHEAAASPVACWVGTSGNFRDFEAVSCAMRALIADGVLRLRVISDRPLDTREWRGAEWVPWSFEREVAELARCDLGVMPLRDNERTRGRCGYKALQYQAAGLPVVASAVGGAAEAVLDGETGMLVSTGEAWREAVVRLAGDVALRARLGHAGRRRIAERYCMHANAATLASLLRAASARRALPC